MIINDSNINTDELKEIIRCFNATNEIPVRVYDRSFVLIEKTNNWADLFFESTISSKNLAMIFDQFRHINQREEILLIIDDLKMSYGVIPLLDGLEVIGIAIIGPALIEQDPIDTYILPPQFIGNQKKSFLEAYNSLSHISTKQLKNMCKALLALVYSNIDFFNTKFFTSSTDNQYNYSGTKYDEHDDTNLKYSLDIYHNFRYMVVECLQTGDKKKLKTLFAQFNTSNTETRTFIERKAIVRIMLNLLSFPLVGLGVNLKVITDDYMRFLTEIDKCESITSLTTIAESLVNHFLDLAKENSHKHYSKQIKEAMNYIDQHYNENISISVVAEIVHFSSKYFSRIFKDETGVTFSKYLTTKRMDKATQLLDYTDFSLDDIALAVGYNDQSYFTKVFKKQYNITPKKYRVKK